MEDKWLCRKFLIYMYIQFRVAFMHKPTTWKIKEIFHFLETITQRIKLGWAKSTLSSFATEDRNLLNLSL